jgi:hypothetical protein
LKHFCVAGALALATLSPAAQAASDADLAEIRSQIKSLKDEYEARIRALEERLKEAESRAAAPASMPAAASPGSGLAAFNPAISLVLQGTYAHLSRGTGTIPRGFNLGETELTLSANADDRFAGQATVSLARDGEVSVEEAFASYTAAPYGLAPKFGRFFSGIGYLNEQHAHAWDFVDAPLAYEAFLGGKSVTDGAQLKWVAPLEHFVELGGEAGADSRALYAHTGGDVGDSHSWRAGVSWLRTRGDAAARNDTGVVDFVWKWAPNGNARQTSFKLQGEYLGERNARGRGWYLQAVYQPFPLWRIGARYDRIDAGAGQAFDPKRYAAMVDWSPSEFSRVRLQLARSHALPGVTDNQLFVQYILSLGAHGAHKY